MLNIILIKISRALGSTPNVIAVTDRQLNTWNSLGALSAKMYEQYFAKPIQCGWFIYYRSLRQIRLHEITARFSLFFSVFRPRRECFLPDARKIMFSPRYIPATFSLCRFALFAFQFFAFYFIARSFCAPKENETETIYELQLRESSKRESDSFLIENGVLWSKWSGSARLLIAIHTLSMVVMAVNATTPSHHVGSPFDSFILQIASEKLQENLILNWSCFVVDKLTAIIGSIDEWQRSVSFINLHAIKDPTEKRENQHGTVVSRNFECRRESNRFLRHEHGQLWKRPRRECRIKQLAFFIVLISKLRIIWKSRLGAEHFDSIVRETTVIHWAAICWTENGRMFFFFFQCFGAQNELMVALAELTCAKRALQTHGPWRKKSFCFSTLIASPTSSAAYH